MTGLFSGAGIWVVFIVLGLGVAYAMYRIWHKDTSGPFYPRTPSAGSGPLIGTGGAKGTGSGTVADPKKDLK